MQSISILLEEKIIRKHRTWKRTAAFVTAMALTVGAASAFPASAGGGKYTVLHDGRHGDNSSGSSARYS